MSIPSALKQLVWDKYIGKEKGIAECYLRCGTEIRQSHFECGHIISRRDGGPNICENLRPICSKCNKSMSAKNMIVFVNNNGFTKCPLYDKDFNETKLNLSIKNILCSGALDDILNNIKDYKNKSSLKNNKLTNGEKKTRGFAEIVTNHNRWNDEVQLEYYIRKKLGQKLFITKEIDERTTIVSGRDLCKLIGNSECVMKMYDHLKFCFDARDETDTINENKEIIEIFNDDFGNNRVVIHSYKGNIYAFIVSVMDYYKYDYWSTRIDEYTELPNKDYIDYSCNGTVNIIKDLIMKINDMY